MSQAKRERIRRALVRNWRGVSDRVDRVRLDRAGLDRIEALDHVVRVEPVVHLFGKASLDAKRQHDASAASMPEGSRFFADRLLAGRLFEPGDGNAAIVHEYLLYRWGMVDDHAAEAAIGRTLRLRVSLDAAEHSELDLDVERDRGRRRRQDARPGIRPEAVSGRRPLLADPS